jgi:hypothetical protein
MTILNASLSEQVEERLKRFISERLAFDEIANRQTV